MTWRSGCLVWRIRSVWPLEELTNLLNLVQIMLYIDDGVFFARSQSDLDRLTGSFTALCEGIGLSLTSQVIGTFGVARDSAYFDVLGFRLRYDGQMERLCFFNKMRRQSFIVLHSNASVSLHERMQMLMYMECAKKMFMEVGCVPPLKKILEHTSQTLRQVSGVKKQFSFVPLLFAFGTKTSFLHRHLDGLCGTLKRLLKKSREDPLLRAVLGYCFSNRFGLRLSVE